MSIEHLSANHIVAVVGMFPEIYQKDKFHFPSGEIQLRAGRHIAPNKGFGIRHIWAEHQKELASLGFYTIEQTVDFVKAIITHNARIFCEFADIRGHHRPIILKTSIGMAVLEPKQSTQGTVYSVVTAYRRSNAHGIQIGTIPSSCKDKKE